MKFKFLKWTFVWLISCLFIITLYTLSTPKSVYAQQPTGSIATVTGTPTGPLGSVISYRAEENGINIRSGPGADYPVIGKMWLDQNYPILGKSPGGDWLLIDDPSIAEGKGWVYSFYVNITGGEIPVAEVPPTPQPRATNPIDPTLAAQFITTPLATKLPTFTPSGPLVIPTFEEFDSQSFAGIPIGLIIMALLGLGIIMILVSYFTAR